MTIIRRLMALFCRPKPDAAMIARRAMRLHNRSPDAAKRYEDKHMILAKGAIR